MKDSNGQGKNMFKTAEEFYTRALRMAEELGEPKEIRAELQRYIEMSQKHSAAPTRKKMSKKAKRQKKLIQKALERKIKNLAEVQVVKGIRSLKSLDFEICREVAKAGWTLTEEDEKVVIYSYLPTMHK